MDGYYAYFGTWSIDSSNGGVTHHSGQSLYAAEQGENLVRQLVLAGDRLTLSARTHEMGEAHTQKLVWRRIRTGQRE